MLNTMIRPKKSTIFLLLLVPVAWYIFSVFIPLVVAVFYSFFEWKGGPAKTFIGWGNYISMIHDKLFWQAFGHNIYLVVVCIIGQIGLAFVFVLMIMSRFVKLKGIHRTLAFFPSTISAIAIGFIWSMIYNYRYGLLNWFLKAIGRSDLVSVWLNEPKFALILVSLPLIWQFIGYYMVILFSAVAAIPQEIFESAELDGASGFQRAVHIVLPLTKNMIFVCITLCIAGNMKAFDHIYIMTNGGPGTASNVMALYAYTVSFRQSNMGYGSTVSIGIFVLSLAIILGSRALLNYFSKEEAGL
ncbi:MAG: sugar ABC transporter permease [Spirochaetia bacterium]|jgi:raffinose/stachyose/melibiose transport system permease protein|nr:sugar ABC transporter permease [Spirochaetia bacterium]